MPDWTVQGKNVIELLLKYWGDLGDRIVVKV